MRLLYFVLIIFLFNITLHAQQVNKLLIIGMDGCRSDALQQANTPNIDALIQESIHSFDALNDDITISGPAWSAILCGVWSDKHEVTGNDFTNNNYAEYPSMFKYVEDFNPALKTVSFCHWGPINDHIIADDVDFKTNVSSDEEVGSLASQYLKNNEVDLMFLHFDDIDHAGHNSGFTPMNPDYINSIETTDTHIGVVINGLQERSNYENENWLIIIIPDHGGLGTSHGGNSFQEQNVFFIASSKNITPREIKKDSTVVFTENCLGEISHLSFSSNDQAIIPDNQLYNFNNEENFTIECRVKTNQSGDFSIIGNKDWDSGVNPGFVFSFKYPSGPEWKVNIGDGSNRVDVETGGEIADGEWHMLSATFDRSGFLKIYQDGIIIDSADISSIGDIDVGQGLFLGADINNSYNYEGSLSELRVWNTVLSKEEIFQWQCSSITSDHSSYEMLAGYWPLSEGDGETLQDLSQNENNGMVISGEWVNSNSTIQYDYSNTPRLVDIPITGLNHLCIPIQDAWNLDGENIGESCITKTNDSQDMYKYVSIGPNPVNKMLTIHFDSYLTKEKRISLIDFKGSRIFSALTSNQIIEVDTDVFQTGVYMLFIETEGEVLSKKINVIK